MSKLFVIKCKRTQRFRVRSYKSGNCHSSRKRVILEKFTENGWTEVENETESVGNATEIVRKFVLRTYKMYGAPRPTKLIMYEDAGPVQSVEELRRRYVPEILEDETESEIEIDMYEVKLIDDE